MRSRISSRKRVHAHVRGVDHQVRRDGDRLEQLALRGDGLAQTHLAGDQRMLAARLGIALEQHLLGGVQVQDLAIDAAAPQLGDQGGNGFDFVGSIARIQTHGGPRIGVAHAADRVRNEGLEQCGGNVVDTVEVDVFQHVQGNALAGAGQPAHDDQPH